MPIEVLVPFGVGGRVRYPGDVIPDNLADAVRKRIPGSAWREVTTEESQAPEREALVRWEYVGPEQEESPVIEEPEPEPAPEPVGADNDEPCVRQDWGAYSVEDLRAQAKRLGIKHNRRTSRETLVERIEEATGCGDTDGDA